MDEHVAGCINEAGVHRLHFAIDCAIVKGDWFARSHALLPGASPLFLLQMQKSLLGIDIQFKVAQKIQPEQAGDFGVRDGVVDGDHEIADLQKLLTLGMFNKKPGIPMS